MRTLWAVLRRETWERRQIVWLGLFLGVLCPLVASLPLGLHTPTDTLRDGMVLGAAVGFFLLMSLLVGMGLFVSDQAAGRVGFYLARPVRPWQLLVGRVVAAALVLLLGTLLISLPTLVLSGDVSDELSGDSLALAAGLVALALAVFHVTAVALRLRGRWTLFDMASATAVALLVGSILQQAEEARLVGIGGALQFFLAILVMAAAALATWVQLRHGGVQRGRLHAAFSLPFWLIVLSATTFYDVQLRFDLAKGWDDIESFTDVVPASDGSAVWLTSLEGLPAPGSFLFDRERDVAIPVGPVTWMRRQPLVEGRTAVWLDCDTWQKNRRRSTEGCAFRRLDLSTEPPRPVELGILRAPWDRVQTILLSRDGRRLAELRSDDRLILWALPEGRRVREVEIEDVLALWRLETDGSVVAVVRHDTGPDPPEFRIAAVSADGSVQVLPPDDRPGGSKIVDDEGGLEMWDGSRWLIDPETQFPNMPLDILLDAQGKRLVGDWVVWVDYPQLILQAAGLDGHRLDPLALPSSVPHHLDADQLAYPVFDLGPEVAGGRVLVATGHTVHQKLELSFWKGLTPFSHRGWNLDFSRITVTENRESWSTHYVDVGAGKILATFEGFKPLRKRIETASGSEAWLVDDTRGMPHRFDPARLDSEDPIGSLEPVFRPPWSEEE